MGRITDSTLFTLVHDFLKIYLPKQRNNSNHTIKAYRTSLEQLFDFVKKERNITLTQITFEILNDGIITEYLDDLESSRGCSISTRNHRLKCIRSFYNYAASMEPTTVIFQMEMRKIPFKKSPTSESISFMSENAVKALLDQPDTQTKNGLRNQFLMILMYDTAARVQEILNLQICDIHLGKTATATLLGKGNKVRTVPLMERTVQHFKNYVAIFHPEADDFSRTPLFYVERKGKVTPMSDDNIRKFMSEYGNAARLVCPDIPEKIYPHLWRHSRAMHLYQHGMDLTLVSQWLGHAHLETTMIYAHADTELKRKAIEKATSVQSPLNDKSAISQFDVNDDEVLKRLYGLK
ncbi:tyrosine-type recombinase/integrase [Tissierella sp.]|uniref:tyrosine-type recombinase/integrase n=1 Tax=Tissierella sp. TaxID=41274 RepID=UPI00303C1718